MRKKKNSTLRSVFLWLFLTLVVALLIYALRDFLNHHALLVAKVNEQNLQIDKLTTQLHGTQAQLEVANQRIDELTNAKLIQQAPKVTISGVEQVVEPKPSIVSTPIIVVTLLSILKGIASLVPAI